MTDKAVRPLSAAELDAVRVRADESVTWLSGQMDVGHRVSDALHKAAHDRARLLATLDEALAAHPSSRDAIWEKWTGGERLAYGCGYRDGRGEALAAERTRLREAVEGLPKHSNRRVSFGEDSIDRLYNLVPLDEVLALLTPESHDQEEPRETPEEPPE